MIYLDNAATTPFDPRVVDAMLPYLRDQFGNPASATHAFGQAAAGAVERAREQVASLIHANPAEIVWTSGATESTNLALKGAARAVGTPEGHLITLETEHKATLDTMKWLARQGYALTVLQPDKSGLISTERFAAAMRPNTILASVMLVNNEIGVIHDVAELGAVCRERGVLFHVDAAQATGKIEIDLAKWPIDLMSLTAHKTYGPKGIGALYVRNAPHVKLEAQIHGGGHERGLRSGTLPTYQIVGMGAAFELAAREMASEIPRIRRQRDRLWAALCDIEGVRMNGDMTQRVANNINLTIENCELPLTELTEVAVSSASACIAGQASHVIAALGGENSGTVLRITIGRFNSDAEIDHAAQYLRFKVLRHLGRKAA